MIEAVKQILRPVRRRLKPSKLQQKQELLQQSILGAYTAAMTGLGVRMGLYKALADAGSVTPEELAKRTGLHERWLREWLRTQAASQVIDYDGNGRFLLSKEAASLLADADSPMFAGQRLLGLPMHYASLARLPESFKSGIGYTWDDRGEEATTQTERARSGWYKRELVGNFLPRIDGAVAKLEAGASVADVGCGTGLALVELAQAFPKSEYHGYEISEVALATARDNAKRAGLSNVTFHQAREEELPSQATFDLVFTFDCLHDMTDPRGVSEQIRRAMKDDGLWVIMEIDGAPTFEENLRRDRRGAATSYAVSILSCLASSMAEPNAVGYGTLGLPEPALRELIESACFTRFRRLNLPAPPMNALYEVRP